MARVFLLASVKDDYKTNVRVHIRFYTQADVLVSLEIDVRRQIWTQD